MNITRRLAFVLAVTALAGGGYFLAQGFGSRPDDREATTPAVGPPGTAAPAPGPATDSAPPLAAAPKTPTRPASSNGSAATGTRVLAGTLVTTGATPTPVRGARVRAASVAGGTLSPWVATDAKGAFRVDGLAPGTYRLIARTSPIGPEIPVLEGVEAADPSAPPLAAVLPPAGAPTPPVSRRVRVLGPDGAPVTTAHVMVGIDGGFGGFLEVEGGSFQRMPVETFGTAYEVFAAKDGRGADLPFGPGRVRAEDAGAAETTELRLPTERTIAGRVVDAAGGPLPGLEVSAFPVPSEGGAKLPVGAVPNAHGTAKTDADGRFLLGRLGTGLYRIQLVVGPGSASPAIPEVAAGTAGIVLRMPLAMEARILVLDPDGAPVPEASVTASAPGPMYGALTPGPDPAGSRRSVANEHGVAFVTGLEADREYVLVASPPPARTDLRWTNGPKGWKPHDDTIRLLRDHVVRGAVHDAAGRPQPGVVLRRLDDGTWKPAGGALPDGSFTLRMLDPGTIVVAAAKDWRSTRGPEVTATVDGEPVVLVLPP